MTSLCKELCLFKEKKYRKGIVTFNSIVVVLSDPSSLKENNRILKYHEIEVLCGDLRRDSSALTSYWTSKSPQFANYSTNSTALDLQAFV